MTMKLLTTTLRGFWLSYVTDWQWEEPPVEIGRLRGLQRTLDYAKLQLDRETKFNQVDRPESRRFWRTHSAVSRGCEELDEILRDMILKDNERQEQKRIEYERRERSEVGPV